MLAYWLALSLVCLAIDYSAGPIIEFPIVIPGSDQHCILVWRTAMGNDARIHPAALSPVFQDGLEPAVDDSGIVDQRRHSDRRFASFAWLIDPTARQMRELRHMHLLEGILGVCSLCKNIRDERLDAWQSLDSYIKAHPDEFRQELCRRAPRTCGTLSTVDEGRRMLRATKNWAVRSHSTS